MENGRTIGLQVALSLSNFPRTEENMENGRTILIIVIIPQYNNYWAIPVNKDTPLWRSSLSICTLSTQIY